MQIKTAQIMYSRALLNNFSVQKFISCSLVVNLGFINHKNYNLVMPGKESSNDSMRAFYIS